MFCNIKNRLLLQFHITGNCNLKCKHCYRSEGNAEPLAYEQVIQVIEQYKSLLKRYNDKHGIKRRGHINITGGEPFIRKDIKQILRYLGSNKEFFSYGILSNGSFIDKEMTAVLKETSVSFIQLSLDGDRKTHDFLRKDGDYDRVLATAKMLEKSEKLSAMGENADAITLLITAGMIFIPRVIIFIDTKKAKKKLKGVQVNGKEIKLDDSGEKGKSEKTTRPTSNNTITAGKTDDSSILSSLSPLA